MVETLRKLIHRLTGKSQPQWFVEALSLFNKNHQDADKVLLTHLSQIERQVLSSEESRWLSDLKALVQLRALVRANTDNCTNDFDNPSLALQAAFLTSYTPSSDRFCPEELNFDEISRASQWVSGLLWQNTCTSQDLSHPLSSQAKALLCSLSRLPMQITIESMRKEGGIPFLLLNSVARKNWKLAKSLGLQLLSKEIVLEEETRVCLYWIAEVLWFSQNQVQVSDFESTIRHLYHLCFINPERAGFLEIDSQFFSQFESVTELAQEGLLFKETLIERILQLWQQQGEVFDSVFVEVLQLLTQQRNKIYQDLALWQQWWEREKADFERAVLFCVEGNLHYSAQRFQQALDCYERALRLDAHLRPALLNRVFCFAQLKDVQGHRKAVEDLLSRNSLFPSNKIASANSYLLINQKEEAHILFQELAQEVEGWEKKAEYYQSIFCLEHGLLDQALYFARLAFEKAPEDQRYGFHLSRCLKESGKTQEALQIVRTLSLSGPEWLLFYRFTLERDAGLLKDAQETLATLSDDYFDDPEELDQALEFAKNTHDLSLLRRLKSRVS